MIGWWAISRAKTGDFVFTLEGKKGSRYLGLILRDDGGRRTETKTKTKTCMVFELEGGSD